MADVQSSAVNTRREPLSTDDTLIYKSMQIAAYADDVNIKARTQQDLKNTSRTKRKEGWSTDKYCKN
jgi:hypothetical protein